jgi:hypothetical protein
MEIMTMIAGIMTGMAIGIAITGTATRMTITTTNSKRQHRMVVLSGRGRAARPPIRWHAWLGLDRTERHEHMWL